VSGQLHVPATLPQGKRPQYPLDRRLGGRQSRSGRSGEEKNPQPPPGIEPLNPDRPARTDRAITVDLRVMKQQGDREDCTVSNFINYAFHPILFG